MGAGGGLRSNMPRSRPGDVDNGGLVVALDGEADTVAMRRLLLCRGGLRPNPIAVAGAGWRNVDRNQSRARRSAMFANGGTFRTKTPAALTEFAGVNMQEVSTGAIRGQRAVGWLVDAGRSGGPVLDVS